MRKSSKAPKHLSAKVESEIVALALQGYAQTEIGAKYGISQSRVSQLLHRAKARASKVGQVTNAAELLKKWR